MMHCWQTGNDEHHQPGRSSCHRSARSIQPRPGKKSLRSSRVALAARYACPWSFHDDTHHSVRSCACASGILDPFVAVFQELFKQDILE